MTQLLLCNRHAPPPCGASRIFTTETQRHGGREKRFRSRYSSLPHRLCGSRIGNLDTPDLRRGMTSKYTTQTRPSCPDLIRASTGNRRETALGSWMAGLRHPKVGVTRPPGRPYIHNKIDIEFRSKKRFTTRARFSYHCPHWASRSVGRRRMTVKRGNGLVARTWRHDMVSHITSVIISARAPERQSARAPERQSARAPERTGASAPA